MERMLRLVTALAAAIALAGCATTVGTTFAGSGVVKSIHEIEKPDPGTQAMGTIGGALLGAWLGSNVGGGSGATVATAVGGVGGAAAGRAVAANRTITVFDVTVLFEDGISRTVRVDQRPAVRVGDRVQVSRGQIIPI